jgi:hypothetical protein
MKRGRMEGRDQVGEEGVTEERKEGQRVGRKEERKEGSTEGCKKIWMKRRRKGRKG